jgi:glycosyltransferase involved in cell wall biosynthesis
MDEVVVLDSGSTDCTVDIARGLGARVETMEFKGFVEQKNVAMDLCTGDWLFNLDADEEVTPVLRESIERVIDKEGGDCCAVWSVPRRTFYFGRWMNHCGWYPEWRPRMSRRGSARWQGEALHETLAGDGATGKLMGDLKHRPYEDLGEHLDTLARYTRIWANREAGRGRSASIIDMVFRPPVRFVKMYLLRLGFLDGLPGLIASVMGAYYVFLKYARLYELTGKNE